MSKKIIVENLEFDFSNSSCSKDELLNLYWYFHPKFRFFKTLHPKTRLLDIGAGSGGMFYWKEWKLPIRNDIEMYAVDKFKSAMFDKYDGHQICNLDECLLKYENEFFDAALASHILEHLKDENKMVQEINRVLKKGGYLYIEIPTPETYRYPSRNLFVERGINVSTTNFYEDKTHLRTFGPEVLTGLLRSHDFQIMESGIIENRFLERELLAYGFRNNDPETSTYAIWSYLKWAQYAIGKKDK